MVVRRRSRLMAVVAAAALLLAVAYLVRFADERSVAPFLLGCGLLGVAGLHAAGWWQARSPLFVADLTGVRVRLGGQWTGLPWSEVEAVTVAERRGWADGRLVVRPRDPQRALSGGGLRARLAVGVNRWLYDAALVVPYGVTTEVTPADVPAALTRLADGRALIEAPSAAEEEPLATVEVLDEAPASADRAAMPEDGFGPPSPHPDSRPRRFAAAVSALRTSAARITDGPRTSGALALAPDAARPGEDTGGDDLPEVAELRRRAFADADDGRTAHVDLMIDGPERQHPVPPTVVPLTASALAAATVHAPPEPSPLATSPGGPAAAIGAELRTAREWLGLSVDDLADRTRIRPVVIESIESGDFGPCGGDFYARGHLRMLAGVLGVEPEPLISTYDEHLAGAPVSPRQVFDAELAGGVVKPTGGGARWGALVGAVLIMLLAWGVARVFLVHPPSQPHGAAVTNHDGLGSPGRGDILSRLAPTPERTRVTLSTPQTASRVVVRDQSGAVVFRGLLHAGDRKEVAGTGPLVVRAANGGAVRVAAAGTPAGPLGKLGEPGRRTIR